MFICIHVYLYTRSGSVSESAKFGRYRFRMFACSTPGDGAAVSEFASEQDVLKRTLVTLKTAFRVRVDLLRIKKICKLISPEQGTILYLSVYVIYIFNNPILNTKLQTTEKGIFTNK